MAFCPAIRRDEDYYYLYETEKLFRDYGHQIRIVTWNRIIIYASVLFILFWA